MVGGTSLGSPSWAGIIAIVDQGRAVAGLGSLDGATQTLPALYAAASSNFNSVASTPSYGGFSFGGFNPFGGGFAGNSQASSSFWGGFGLGIGLSSGSTTSSGATANTSTGLGTPNGASLISDLVASTLTKAVTFIGGSSSTGTGTTPTSPTEPVGKKHHAKKHGHTTTTKHKAHAAKTSGHKLVNQAHTSAKHVSGIRLV